MSTAYSPGLLKIPSARQGTSTSAAAPREELRAQMRCAHAVHGSRAKESLAVLTQEGASHNSSQLSHLQQQ